jgi:hypothetical protein
MGYTTHRGEERASPSEAIAGNLRRHLRKLRHVRHTLVRILDFKEKQPIQLTTNR